MDGSWQKSCHDIEWFMCSYYLKKVFLV